MKIITVLMLATTKGSPDGMTVREYEEGEVYNLPEELALVFINDLEVAEEVEEAEPDDNPDQDKDPE